MTDNKGRSGRVSGEVAAKLRQEILSGHRAGGSYLPGIRDLATKYGVAKVTAGRALKLLEGEGLVAAQPRKGYRVLSGAGDPGNGLPIAYVYSGKYAEGIGSDEAASYRLLEEFQRVAGASNWSLLVVKAEGRPPREIMRSLIAARVCGAITDDVDRELAGLMAEAGMPVVAVDNYLPDAPVDTVVQDGFMGGWLAAQALTGRGHERFGWLGPDPVGCGAQIGERLGGAAAGLAMAGLPIRHLARVAMPLGRPDDASRCAERLLARHPRPSACFALWQDATIALLAACERLGLKPGEDVALAGWCTREELEYGRLTVPPGTPLAVWSMRAMAKTAVARLMQRHRDPSLPVACLRVPVTLLNDGQNENRGKGSRRN